MYQQNRPAAQPLMFRARQGQTIAVRQTVAGDTTLLADLLGRLSEDTRRLRYMSPRFFSPEAIWNEAARMVQGPATLVAVAWPNIYDEVIAVAELVPDRHDRAAGEIALVVQDDMQQQGIGGFLLRCLVGMAQSRGITRLRASMLEENTAMQRLIGAQGLPYNGATRRGETQVVIGVPPHYEQGAGRLAA